MMETVSCSGGFSEPAYRQTRRSAANVLPVINLLSPPRLKKYPTIIRHLFLSHFPSNKYIFIMLCCLYYSYTFNLFASAQWSYDGPAAGCTDVLDALTRNSSSGAPIRSNATSGSSMTVTVMDNRSSSTAAAAIGGRFELFGPMCFIRGAFHIIFDIGALRNVTLSGGNNNSNYNNNVSIFIGRGVHFEGLVDSAAVAANTWPLRLPTLTVRFAPNPSSPFDPNALPVDVAIGGRGGGDGEVESSIDGGGVTWALRGVTIFTNATSSPSPWDLVTLEFGQHIPRGSRITLANAFASVENCFFESQFAALSFDVSLLQIPSSGPLTLLNNTLLLVRNATLQFQHLVAPGFTLYSTLVKGGFFSALSLQGESNSQFIIRDCAVTALHSTFRGGSFYLFSLFSFPMTIQSAAVFAVSTSAVTGLNCSGGIGGLSLALIASLSSSSITIQDTAKMLLRGNTVSVISSHCVTLLLVLLLCSDSSALTITSGSGGGPSSSALLFIARSTVRATNVTVSTTTVTVSGVLMELSGAALSGGGGGGRGGSQLLLDRMTILADGVNMTHVSSGGGGGGGSLLPPRVTLFGFSGSGGFDTLDLADASSIIITRSLVAVVGSSCPFNFTAAANAPPLVSIFSVPTTTLRTNSTIRICSSVASVADTTVTGTYYNHSSGDSSLLLPVAAPRIVRSAFGAVTAVAACDNTTSITTSSSSAAPPCQLTVSNNTDTDQMCASSDALSAFLFGPPTATSTIDNGISTTPTRTKTISPSAVYSPFSFFSSSSSISETANVSETLTTVVSVSNPMVPPPRPPVTLEKRPPVVVVVQTATGTLGTIGAVSTVAAMISTTSAIIRISQCHQPEEDDDDDEGGALLSPLVHPLQFGVGGRIGRGGDNVFSGSGGGNKNNNNVSNNSSAKTTASSSSSAAAARYLRGAIIGNVVVIPVSVAFVFGFVFPVVFLLLVQRKRQTFLKTAGQGQGRVAPATTTSSHITTTSTSRTAAEHHGPSTDQQQQEEQQHVLSPCQMALIVLFPSSYVSSSYATTTNTTATQKLLGNSSNGGGSVSGSSKEEGHGQRQGGHDSRRRNEGGPESAVVAVNDFSNHQSNVATNNNSSPPQPPPRWVVSMLRTLHREVGWPSILVMPQIALVEGTAMAVTRLFFFAVDAAASANNSAENNNSTTTNSTTTNNTSATISSNDSITSSSNTEDVAGLVVPALVGLVALVAVIGLWVRALVDIVPSADVILVPASPVGVALQRGYKKLSLFCFRSCCGSCFGDVGSSSRYHHDAPVDSKDIDDDDDDAIGSTAGRSAIVKDENEEDHPREQQGGGSCCCTTPGVAFLLVPAFEFHIVDQQYQKKQKKDHQQHSVDGDQYTESDGQSCENSGATSSAISRKHQHGNGDKDDGDEGEVEMRSPPAVPLLAVPVLDDDDDDDNTSATTMSDRGVNNNNNTRHSKRDEDKYRRSGGRGGYQRENDEKGNDNRHLREARYEHILGGKALRWAELGAFLCALGVGVAEGLPADASSSSATLCEARVATTFSLIIIQGLLGMTTLVPVENGIFFILSVVSFVVSGAALMKVFNYNNDGQNNNTDSNNSSNSVFNDDQQLLLQRASMAVGIVGLVAIAVALLKPLLALRRLLRSVETMLEEEGNEDDENEALFKEHFLSVGITTCNTITRTAPCTADDGDNDQPLSSLSLSSSSSSSTVATDTATNNNRHDDENAAAGEEKRHIFANDPVAMMGSSSSSSRAASTTASQKRSPSLHHHHHDCNQDTTATATATEENDGKVTSTRRNNKKNMKKMSASESDNVARIHMIPSTSSYECATDEEAEKYNKNDSSSSSCDDNGDNEEMRRRSNSNGEEAALLL